MTLDHGAPARGGERAVRASSDLAGCLMDVIMTSDDALDCLPHQVRELRSRGVLGDDDEENIHVLVEAVELLAAQLSPMPPSMPPPCPRPRPRPLDLNGDR
jgi:hypothetical protein